MDGGRWHAKFWISRTKVQKKDRSVKMFVACSTCCAIVFFTLNCKSELSRMNNFVDKRNSSPLLRLEMLARNRKTETCWYVAHTLSKHFSVDESVAQSDDPQSAVGWVDHAQHGVCGAIFIVYRWNHKMSGCERQQCAFETSKQQQNHVDRNRSSN